MKEKRRRRSEQTPVEPSFFQCVYSIVRVCTFCDEAHTLCFSLFASFGRERRLSVFYFVCGLLHFVIGKDQFNLIQLYIFLIEFVHFGKIVSILFVKKIWYRSEFIQLWIFNWSGDQKRLLLTSQRIKILSWSLLFDLFKKSALGISYTDKTVEYFISSKWWWIYFDAWINALFFFFTL